MTERRSKGPRYASALHKEIAAAINDLYRFRGEAQAVAKLDAIKRQFTLAKEEAPDPQSILLWIRDFELTPEEEAEGYLGHYARMAPYRRRDEDAYWALGVEKIERPLKNHPVRKRLEARAPNWGHPILRSVQKIKTYETIHQAMDQLEALHLEYPETTIPADSMCKL